MSNPLKHYTNEIVGAFVLLTVAVICFRLATDRAITRMFDPGAVIKIILPSEGLFGLVEGADVEILWYPCW